MSFVRRAAALRLSILVLSLAMLPWRAARGAEIQEAAEPIGDRYIVTVLPRTDTDAVANKLAAKYGGTLLAVWKHAIHGFWIALPADKASLLAKDPLVRTIEEDAEVHQSSDGAEPTGAGSEVAAIDPEQGDPSPDPLWHLTRISHRNRAPRDGATPQEKSDFYQYRYANDGSFGSDEASRVKVYMIDVGIWSRHAELNGVDNSRLAVKPGFSAAANPDYDRPTGTKVAADPVIPDPSAADEVCAGFQKPPATYAHGTGCASMVVGKKVGVAKGAEIIAITSWSCGDSTLHFSAAMLLSALDFVVADVANDTTRRAVLSMSTFRFVEPVATQTCKIGDTNCTMQPDLDVIEEAVNAVVDSGVPVIVSANNHNSDACTGTPARLSRRSGRKDAFGHATRVITVGGIHGLRDERWVNDHDTHPEKNPGSNYGQCVDIFAPASHIPVAYPGATGTEYSPAHAGTSYSAPIVAGAVARLIASSPSLRATPRAAMADEVWKLLEANATPFDAANLGAASPHRMLYIGNATFTQQPPSTLNVAAASDEVTLTVAVAEAGVEYQWYRGNPEDTTDPVEDATSATLSFIASTDTQLTTDNVQKYWVRVKRTDVCPAGETCNAAHRPYYADSNAAEVHLLQPVCALPVITQQPRTQWLTGSTTSASLTATIGALTGNVRWEWQRIDLNPAQPTVLLSGTAPADPVPALPVNTSAGAGATYRLVLCNGTNCQTSSCKVVSDTAQVRSCSQVVAPVIETRFIAPSNHNIGYTRLRVQAADGNALRWFFRAPGASTPSVLRYELTDAEANEQGHINWLTFRDQSIPAQEKGCYSIQIGNACTTAMSNEACIDTPPCYFELRGKNPYGPDQYAPQDIPDFPVPPGEPVTLLASEVHFGTLGAVAPRLTYHWEGPGNTTTTTSTLVTGPIWTPTTYRVTATDERSKCVQPAAGPMEFRLVPTGLCVREIQLYGGLCHLEAEPKIAVAPNSVISLRPHILDASGVNVPDLAPPGDLGAFAEDNFDFHWTINEIGQDTRTYSGHGLGYATLEYTVTTNATIVVKVTTAEGCQQQMTYRVDPLPIAACTTNCNVTCKQRAVRVGESPVIIKPFTPGDTITMSAPEQPGGTTYAWYRLVGSTTTAIGTTEDLTVTLDVPAQYWVVMDTGAGIEQSEHLIAVLKTGASEVTITPAYNVVPAGSTATFTAWFEHADANTRYEWRSGDAYLLSAPAIGNTATLTLSNVQNDQVFWCRVIQINEDDTVTNYNSDFVSLAVTCNDTVGGSILANPAHVTRNQTARLTAVGPGKGLQYSWTRTLPNDPTPVPVGGMYGVIDVSVTEPETYFGATATDACGHSGSFGPVVVYRCVPTITQQPVASTVVTPGTSVTLTVAATPAVDGQTLTVKWYHSNDINRIYPLGAGWSFTTTLPTGTNIDSYYAAIASDCGGGEHIVKSAIATVETCAYPTVGTQPVTFWSTPNAPVMLSAGAGGTELTYQWYGGATGDTSALFNNQTNSTLHASPSTTSSYWCRVKSRGTCSTDTQTFTVKICSPVVITSQPANLLSFTGKTNTLSVTVDTGTNTEPITYQWQVAAAGGAWSDIAGATATTYVTPPFTADAVYRLHINVGICETDSEPIAVTMCTYPEVVAGGERKIGYAESASISLPVMSPVVTKTITWYRGDVGNRATPVLYGEGVNLTHSTGPLTQDTLYWAEFTTDTCTSHTEVFTVRVCKPSVTTQPTGSTIASGNSWAMTVGTTPIAGQTFQWYTGTSGTTTNPVAGATSATLTATPSATTSYWVRVTGTCGLTADSAAAVVTVCNPPAITNSSPSLEMQASTPHALFVTATGSNLTLQWYRGTTGVTTNPIANATGAILDISPSTTTSYWCRVTSEGLCTADSPTITATVCNPPVITAQPASQRIFTGSAATLQITATALGAMTYQWYTGVSGDTASPVANATSASLTVTPSVDTSYWCRVTTSVCSVDSDAASISFCTYPAVVVGGDRTLAYQQSAALSLPVMSPVATKDITWYRGNVGDHTNPVASGSGVNLTYNTPLLTASTNYWAEFVTDGCVSRTDAFTVRVCKPTITTQPTGTTVAAGSPATLTAAVTSISGQTFQWYAGTPGTTTNPVAGATSASLTISPVATTSYWLRVTGTCGFSADSSAATITVCNPAVINSVTPSHSALSGSSQLLVVSATGTSLTYQWYRGTTGVTTNPIANATSSSVQVAPTTTTSYWCKVTSSGLCTANSATITIDVCTPPTITVQPLSQPQFAGKQVTLSVTASSSGAMTYQWYQGASGDTAAPVAGATASTFTFTATVDTSYWCRVTTAVCTTDSAAASITLCTYSEVVSASPASRNTYAGESVTMSLPTMSPVATKNITWYRGASGNHATPLLSGTGTNLSLSVSPTVTTQYWAEFDTGGCVSRTETYTVNVCKPTITTQPQGVVIQNGAQTTLTVAATGAPLTYQWYIGAAGNTSQPIAGATSSSYTTPALATTTSYWVRVSGCTTADSAAATVTVCNTPTVTLSKSAQATAGTVGTITATATGTSLTYQWFRGQSGDTSNPISGATGSAYSFTLSASNYYWVRVTTGCSGASVNSAAILYSVIPVITAHPVSVTIPSGGHTTFSVTATGNFLTYQWYRNGSLISGATLATYTTPALTATTTYFCKVSSGAVYAFSNEATATMCEGPLIMSFATTYSSGTTRGLTVTVHFSQAATVRYHWYKGVVGEPTQSVDLGEQSNVMFFYNVAAPASTYWVRVWLDDGTCYSDTPGINLP